MWDGLDRSVGFEDCVKVRAGVAKEEYVDASENPAFSSFILIIAD